MIYHQNLQVRLQERYRRLYKASHRLYHHEAGYLVAFIRERAALRLIVEAIERSEPDLDPHGWAAEHFTLKRAEWPPTEVGRAKVAWHLLQTWALTEDASTMFGRNLDRSESNLDACSRTATEVVIEPLVEHLQEQLGESSDTLHLLERYVRRVEWFEQDRLWKTYEANTRTGEAGYDTDLRHFLFDQGVDYPFSQPASASGLTDVVANVETDDPLVCEIKLYNGDSYGKAYLAKGVQQTATYARDYGKTAGYLVIINLTTDVLELPTDSETSAWPPRINVGDVTVFLIQIRARPQPSASKRGSSTVVMSPKMTWSIESGARDVGDRTSAMTQAVIS